MGDCWIYYSELCLAGKTWDKKNAAQTRRCGIHQTLVREVVADHFKRKTQHLQLQYAEPMENATHLWCFASADHDNLFWVQKGSKFYFSATSWGIYQTNCLDAQSGTLKRAIIIIYHWCITRCSSERTIHWYEDTLSIVWPLLWGQPLSPGSDVDFLWVFADPPPPLFICQQVQQHISVSLCQPCEGLLT